MTLLERLGLAPKPALRPRLAGLRFEGRPTEPAQPALTRRQLAIRAALVTGIAGLALLAFPNVSVLDETSAIGDVWKGDDVVAPYDFSIRLPDAVVVARRDSVRRSEPLIMTIDVTAPDSAVATLDRIDARLDTAFVAYAGWQAARAASDPLQAAADSVRYRRAALELPLTPEQWSLLLAGVETGNATRLSDRLLGDASRVSRALLVRGVADVPRDSLLAASVLVRDLSPAARTEETRDARSVIAVDEVTAAARAALEEDGLRGDTLTLAEALTARALRPSLLYDGDATTRRREATVRAVLPTAGRVLRSTTIIRRGDVVTPEKADQLRSLDIAQRDRSGVSWVQTVLGRALLVLAALMPFLLFLRLLRPNIYGDTRKVVLVALVIGTVIAGYLAAGIAGGETRFAVPVALAVVLLTISFDSRVGSFATITLALVGGLVFGFDFEFLFATLIVGVLAVFSVRDVKSRSQLLASSGLIAVAYGIVVLGYALLRAEPFTDRFVGEALAAATSALLLLLAAPLLWGIERAFGVTTDLTLLELSDTNRPLLKELSVRAPGTFNHALQVANLAEAAADAIGANALRARVGALYHDIGKMLKPEYFVENQRPGENPHDALKPSMSALVIAAHVRDGLDLGRQNRLPTVVLDFIGTHHGTGVMEYFYRKAEEQRGPEDAPVDEADYRYPGPRPFTNEQAIVMLADSVEAASRSLDRPTPRRLESLVETIVAARIAAGQLDTCGLTFQDVARIKETFLAMLAGIYHFRVRYPGQAAEPADEPVAQADLREP
ncbi:MAG TPA: HDIG domain-containing protein [Rubricoccaceae bacterium]|jgi:hypothetical protein